MAKTHFKCHQNLTITIITGCFLIVGALVNLTSCFGFGEVCKEEKDCQDISLLLTCKNEKCGCIDDAFVELDSVNQQCVAQEEASCYREGPANDNKFHYVPCIKNSVCGSRSKTCECDELFYSAGNGSCLPQKQFGEPCRLNSNITECDAFRILSCLSSGTCGCAKGLQYNKKLDTCFLPLGSTCVRGNYFHNPIFAGRHDSCPLQAECYNGVCVCRPGFKPSTDGNCGGDFGNLCGIDAPCSNIQFVCRSGTCHCKYPLHQFYNSSKRECLSIVPGPCENALIGCVPNAECVKGQCRCQDRYKQNRLGYCVKPFGYDCELDSECDNTKINLACINNQCSCPDLLQKFDRETGNCLGMVGARCSLNFDNFSHDGNSTCVEGAECNPFGPGPEQQQYGEDGECLCQENYIKTEEGICSNDSV